jgi:ribosomal-protein-alanine N-acetyltransferase
MSRRSPERVLTSRLICERLIPDHGEELMVLLRDPLVARTLFPGGTVPSEAEVLENLGVKVVHWERTGFGMWLLRDRETGAMIGRGGLQYTFVADRHEVEAGWAIIPERWGEGLATELAHAAMQVAFEDLGLLEVVAFTLPENRASQRVMEKSGFALQGPIIHVGVPHVLFRRTAETGGGAHVGGCGLCRRAEEG